MSDLDDSLSAALDQLEEGGAIYFGNNTVIPATPTPTVPIDKEGDSYSQWMQFGNGRFSPTGTTTPRLPAGVYEPFATSNQWGLELMHIASDGIYTLPDMATETVLKEVNTFWSNEAKYRTHNLLYKRGILLHGPPGGGKSVCIKLLMGELVKRDGIVIFTKTVNLTLRCLKAIRRIEPTRNLIAVLEDIDEIIRNTGEASVLSMLDGEDNIDNILHVASTNFPERLGARISNRPSRFDRRVFVGMPSDLARRTYLQKATKNGLDNDTLDLWSKDTKEMSIAHLRELVAAVYCLDQPYPEVLERLVKMAEQPTSDDEFKRKGVGFSPSRPGSTPQGW